MPPDDSPDTPGAAVPLPSCTSSRASRSWPTTPRRTAWHSGRSNCGCVSCRPWRWRAAAMSNAPTDSSRNWPTRAVATRRRWACFAHPQGPGAGCARRRTARAPPGGRIPALCARLRQRLPVQRRERRERRCVLRRHQCRDDGRAQGRPGARPRDRAASPGDLHRSACTRCRSRCATGASQPRRSGTDPGRCRGRRLALWPRGGAGGHALRRHQFDTTPGAVVGSTSPR